MKCSNCGAEVMNGTQFCQICGAAVTMQPQQTYGQQSGYNPSYGQPQYGQTNQYQNGYNQQNANDVSMEDAGWGFKILSLLIPLAGIILWAVKKSKEPVAAKSCLIWAAIGFGLDILFSVF